MLSWHTYLRVYLRKQGRGSLALLLRGFFQHVRVEDVELRQLVGCEVPLDLLLVHHPERQRLFGYLPVVNLVLHCTLEEENEMGDSQERRTTC